VIASLDGEGARVIQEAQAGVACDAEDAAALAEAVRKLLHSSPDALEQMGRRGRAYYDAHFDPATLAQRLARRFEQLAGGRVGRPTSGSKMESDNG
jgi:glycosyltransferase involved in cell wall biosynthesis